MQEEEIMDFYREIIINVLKDEEVTVSFPNLKFNAKEIVELECYKAIKQIRSILDDDTLTDRTCFKKIEEIVCVFESMGTDGGNRHDFG